MILALDDPLWAYLPGAYGVEDVAGPLSSLLDVWNEEQAAKLLWNTLHHQETLYPVTWSALPWLWKIASKHEEAVLPIFDFVAQVLVVARRSPASYCQFEGLPITSKDLVHWGIRTPQELDRKAE